MRRHSETVGAAFGGPRRGVEVLYFSNGNDAPEVGATSPFRRVEEMEQWVAVISPMPFIGA